MVLFFVQTNKFRSDHFPQLKELKLLIFIAILRRWIIYVASVIIPEKRLQTNPEIDSGPLRICGVTTYAYTATFLSFLSLGERIFQTVRQENVGRIRMNPIR